MKTTGSVINSMAGSYGSSKGDWRKSNVFVGNRYFTDYPKVETEIEKLCRKLNKMLSSVKSEKEIYDLAFDAHFYLVSIHPFAEGN